MSTVIEATFGLTTQNTIENNVETIVDPLVEKYDLEQVEINWSEKSTLARTNEFVAYFKKRLNQFLIRNGRIEMAHEMKHSVAGGFLSDSYMKNQPELNNEESYVVTENKYKSKDVDVFMEVPVSAFRGLDVESFIEEIREELKIASGSSFSSPTFNIKKFERNYSYDFISVPYIFEVSIDKMTRIELILCRDIERIMDFDISIRHFFNFGGTEVYAAKFAIDDIKKKRLSVVCPITPKSTLVRLFYFKKRYGFSIQYNAFNILTWVFKQKGNTPEELIEYVTTVEKFKYDFALRSHLYNMVLVYLEAYTEATDGNVSRKAFVSHELHSVLANEKMYRNSLFVNDNVSYFGEFKMCFPYSDLFRPIYTFITNNSLYDVMFATKFPHGFFGKFYKHLNMGNNLSTFLNEHGLEYLEVLKKCEYSSNGLIMSYVEYEETKSKEQELRDKRKFELELRNLFTLTSDKDKYRYLNKKFVRKLKAGYQSYQAPLPDYCNEEDIPSFLRLANPDPVEFYNVPSPMKIDDTDLPF
ncbi:TPA: hypothetical protein QCR36_004101 [Bacillus cereus]|nr:hypothetical protein [Bacillus cereus]HDR4742566.1 hypothetical protein [Bacillus cereus]HDR4748155.1 hypothetical protein [Bacillus cereus]HDR4753627.1 hypothetical protein [Bacillus cereus]HDR4770836.1 hypothetical protein [Bacillus cereus]